MSGEKEFNCPYLGGKKVEVKRGRPQCGEYRKGKCGGMFGAEGCFDGPSLSECCYRSRQNAIAILGLIEKAYGIKAEADRGEERK